MPRSSELLPSEKASYCITYAMRVLALLVIASVHCLAQQNAIYFPGEKASNNERIESPGRCYPKEKHQRRVLESIDSLPPRSGGCDLNRGTVEYQNRCVRLLSTDNCPKGHHVALDKSTGSAACQVKECGDREVLLPGIGCVSLRDHKQCPPTQRVVVNEFGEGGCDCPPTFLYHTPTNACYPPYTKGPCRHGYIIKVNALTKDSECSQAVCADGMVAMTRDCLLTNSEEAAKGRDYKCYNLGTAGPCKKGIVGVDLTSNEVACSDLTAYAIYNILNVCRPGSRRHSHENCERDTPTDLYEAHYASTVSYTEATCPPGYYYIDHECVLLVDGTAK